MTNRTAEETITDMLVKFSEVLLRPGTMKKSCNGGLNMRTITISLPPEAYASYQELSQATGETPEEAMSRLLEEFLRLTAGLYQE